MSRNEFFAVTNQWPEQSSGYDPEDGDEFLADLVNDIIFTEKAEQDKWE